MGEGGENGKEGRRQGGGEVRKGGRGPSRKRCSHRRNLPLRPRLFGDLPAHSQTCRYSVGDPVKVRCKTC